MKKSFKADLQEFRQAMGRHILVPPAVSEFYREHDIKRFLCSINGQIDIQCAFLSKGNGEYYILINKRICKKFQLEVGEELDIVLSPDQSKYGIALPEEMEVLLEQDPEADQLFHQLTPGKQRSLLFMIGKPKSSAIRLNKAVAITSYLKETRGKVDFKEMNEYLKNFRKLM